MPPPARYLMVAPYSEPTECHLPLNECTHMLEQECYNWKADLLCMYWFIGRPIVQVLEGSVTQYTVVYPTVPTLCLTYLMNGVW